jgi:general secretion pathway protein G
MSTNFVKLAALVIILFLTGWVTSCSFEPLYWSYNVRACSADRQIYEFSKALHAYRADVGGYPRDDSGLAALSLNIEKRNGWAGPYLQGEAPLDPWGLPYIYRCCEKSGEPWIGSPRVYGPLPPTL